MKTLASSDPQRASELLQQAPQLSYAVFQALLLMGLVSPEAIQSVIEPGAPAPAAPPPANYGGATGFAQAPAATNTPPVASMPFAAPAAAAGGQDTDQLMRALMELPQAQIDMLPESERQQVMALRAAFGAPPRR